MMHSKQNIKFLCHHATFIKCTTGKIVPLCFETFTGTECEARASGWVYRIICEHETGIGGRKYSMAWLCKKHSNDHL